MEKECRSEHDEAAIHTLYAIFGGIATYSLIMDVFNRVYEASSSLGNLPQDEYIQYAFPLSAGISIEVGVIALLIGFTALSSYKAFEDVKEIFSDQNYKSIS